MRSFPWPAAWFMPLDETGIYPFVGGECAVAFEQRDVDTTAKASKHGATGMGALIFLRLSGSRGHLARLGAAFYHSLKHVEIFDLGGGLMAVGINGARPAFEAHAPPMVVSNVALENAATPLLRASFSSVVSAAAALAEPAEPVLDLTDEVVGELFERGVPDSVLRALQKPPAVGDMFG